MRLCGCVWQAQTKRGADAAARISKEKAMGGKMKGAHIGGRSIDECGAN